MASSPERMLSSFLLGAASAVCTILLYQHLLVSKSNDSTKDSRDNLSDEHAINASDCNHSHKKPSTQKYEQDGKKMATMTTTTTTTTTKPTMPTTQEPTMMIWDSPDLDLRLLRKAEAVIRLRSFGLTVVVERCTNDHNYSAILRTAEALGVQNIAIINNSHKSQNQNTGQEEGEEGLTVPSTTMIAAQNKNNNKDNNEDNDNKEDTSQPNNHPAAWTMSTVSTTPNSQSNHGVSDSLQEKHEKMDTKNKKVQLTRQEMEQHQLHHLFAKNATEWLTITEYDTTQECVQDLKATRHQVWVTDLSQEAVPLLPEALKNVQQQQQQQQTSSSFGSEKDADGISASSACWPLPDKLAIVFGTEAVGCSQEMLHLADLRVYLPLRGFADSLNLSVATALVLHHLFLLHPTYVGSSTPEQRLALRQVWFPKLAQQRMLSSREKKERRRLQSDIQKCQTLQAKHEAFLAAQAASAASGDSKAVIISPLTKQQMEKLQQLEEHQRQLAELEASAHYQGANAKTFEEWIQNPPEPLSDLRRPDSHRITFVGKSTKRNNQEHWNGMAAVSNIQSKYQSTAHFFRQQVADVQEKK